MPSSNRLHLAKRIGLRIQERIMHHPAYPHSTHSTGKIRIGYVSPDFRNHPTARLTRRLYLLHNRSKFEVYGYSLYPGDGSPLRQDIEQGCNVFRELHGLDDSAAADLIHQDGIDILIDLAGYTTHARPEIFAMRPSPLQISYLGFPGTTGAACMDYFIGDPTITPPVMQQQFSEQIAYMPECYFMFDNQQPITDIAQTRAAHGLPEYGTVFCCFNNPNKITSHDFDIWMELLKRLPNSVLWLLANNQSTITNLRNEMEQHGVNAERLVFAGFLPNDQHIARYRLADLFLDTLYYNAHTTAAEALWAGLPVLTCQGDTMAARVASSLLSAVGLNELITTTPQQYEELAIHFASHPEELVRLRALLAHNRLRSPLFDTERQVQKIEQIYLHIWQRHQAGLPPETFQISG